ncbi:hypothetical protein NX059_012378 [Plenodomus lindquistii]|nr:hypothetical protein NX059_012378 [Plenodomus lindquistii]
MVLRGIVTQTPCAQASRFSQSVWSKSDAWPAFRTACTSRRYVSNLNKLVKKGATTRPWPVVWGKLVRARQKGDDVYEEFQRGTIDAETWRSVGSGVVSTTAGRGYTFNTTSRKRNVDRATALKDDHNDARCVDVAGDMHDSESTRKRQRRSEVSYPEAEVTRRAMSRSSDVECERRGKDSDSEFDGDADGPENWIPGLVPDSSGVEEISTIQPPQLKHHEFRQAIQERPTQEKPFDCSSLVQSTETQARSLTPAMKDCRLMIL